MTIKEECARIKIVQRATQYTFSIRHARQCFPKLPWCNLFPRLYAACAAAACGWASDCICMICAIVSQVIIIRKRWGLPVIESDHSFLAHPWSASLFSFCRVISPDLMTARIWSTHFLVNKFQSSVYGHHGFCLVLFEQDRPHQLVDICIIFQAGEFLIF